MADHLAGLLFDNAVILTPTVVIACLLTFTLLVRRWPRRTWSRVGAVALSLLLGFISLLAGALLYAERNVRAIIEHRVHVLTLHPAGAAGPMKVAQLQGRVVLLNFWATWCPPCRAELPDMNRLADHFPRADVAIVTITDEPRERVALFEATVLPLRTINATFDSDQPQGGLAAAAYQGRPTTIILDKNGRVCEIYIGQQSYETLRKAVERQLGRQARANALLNKFRELAEPEVRIEGECISQPTQVARSVDHQNALVR